jgi:hypothetical protein
MTETMVTISLELYEAFKKIEEKNKELESHMDTIRIIHAPYIPPGMAYDAHPTVVYEIKDKFLRRIMTEKEEAERKLSSLKEHLLSMDRQERKEFIKWGRWSHYEF